MPNPSDTFRYPVYVFYPPFPRKLFPGVSRLKGIAHDDAELIATIKEGMNASLNGEVILSTLPKPFSEYAKKLPKFKKFQPTSAFHGTFK